MKILVVGRGWTGHKVAQEVLRRGHSLTFLSHERSMDALSNESFDWAINCAGVTGVPNVDACELNKSGTLQGNAIFPVQLAERCELYDVRLAHFSSGCIYEGEITSVDADPNYFGSIYSVSKGISDTLLKDKAQVYRIRMPFTGENEPKNYLTKVLNYAKNGKLIDGGKNSLTDLNEAVQVVLDLIEADEPNGYYNLVNKGSVTMHELADLLQINPKWFTPEEFKKVTLASRSNCTIPAHEKMSRVEDALKRAIKTLK